MKDWKQISGFETLYSANCNGEILSHRTGVMYKHKVNNRGYPVVSLRDSSGALHTLTVHRIVASLFVENPKMKPCVNHIDGNRLNCSASNLEWVTYSENNKHAFSMGSFTKDNMAIYRLHEKSRKPVLQSSLDGSCVKKWDSISDASRSLGFDPSGISMACTGKMRTYKGFIWRHA